MISHHDMIRLGFKQCPKSHNRYELQEFSTKYVATLDKSCITRLKAIKYNYLTGHSSTVSYPVFTYSLKDFVLAYEEITGHHLPFGIEERQQIALIKIAIALTVLVGAGLICLYLMF